MAYRIKKVTKNFINEKDDFVEHLGFVDTPEEFNQYLHNNFTKHNFAMTPADIVTYGHGSKAFTIVDLSKMNCPLQEGVVFTIISQQDKKLI